MPRGRIGDAMPSRGGGLDATPSGAADRDPFATGNPVALTSVDTGQQGAGLLQTQGDALFGGLVGYNATDTYNPDDGTGTYRSFLDQDGNLTVASLKTNQTIFINDTANANMTTGITINQGAADDEIFDLKSSDIAHGMTAITETDTYAYVQKHDNAAGGLFLTGLTEDTVGLRLRGCAPNGDTTQAEAAVATILLDASRKSGTGLGTFGSGDTYGLVAFRDNTLTRFIFSSEGDWYYKGGLGGSGILIAFDDYDDAALLETYRIAIDGADLAQTFDYDIERNKEVLIRNGVVKQGADGGLMVNHKGLNGLLMDAIRQGAHKQHALEERLAALEQRLNKET